MQFGKAPSLVPFAASYGASEITGGESLVAAQRNSDTINSLLVAGDVLPLFVQKAAAVLNSELEAVAGLGTELPGKISTANFPRPVPGIARFPQQARELVELLVKLLEHWPEYSAQFESESAGIGGRFRGDESQCVVPVLKLPPPVSPGQAAHVLLTLENDDSEGVDCCLFTTDIIGTSGQRIPSAHINVFPRQVRLLPSGSAEVDIEVRVPREAPPGTYSGLLQVYDGRLEQAVIQVLVRA